jgi:hypothetical protein
MMKSTDYEASHYALFTSLVTVFVISLNILHSTHLPWGMQRSWLRHYAASRKVVGLIPDEVI